MEALPEDFQAGAAASAGAALPADGKPAQMRSADCDSKREK